MAMRLWKRKKPRREDKPLKERRKIAGKVLDDESIDVILHFMNGKLIKSLDYPVAEGKESIVFRATAGEKADVRWVKGVETRVKFKPKFFAVKIFKHETSPFQHMADYIEGDTRFREAKKNRRELARQWAGKEFANLKIAQEAARRCQSPSGEGQTWW